MEILIPSLISALALGAFCCPALARPVDYLLSGGTITTIPTFDLTAVPDWWLSGGFAAHPAGTAATLALLFLISLLFFSMEQAKGCGEDGGVLGSARIKTGTELVRGSVTWDGAPKRAASHTASPRASTYSSLSATYCSTAPRGRARRASASFRPSTCSPMVTGPTAPSRSPSPSRT